MWIFFLDVICFPPAILFCHEKKCLIIDLFFHVWLNENIFVNEQKDVLQKHLFISKKHHKQMFSSWASDIVKCCKILCHERETCFHELKTVSQTIISIHEQATLKKNPQICLQEILLNAFSFFIPLAKPLGHKPKIWFHTQKIVSRATSDKNLFYVQIYFFFYMSKISWPWVKNVF